MNTHLKEAQERINRLFEMEDKGDLKPMAARVEIDQIYHELLLSLPCVDKTVKTHREQQETYGRPDHEEASGYHW